MKVKQIVPPSQKPLSLSEVKNYCRIIGNDQDQTLETLIDAATGMFENYTSRQLCEATFEVVASNGVILPKSPVIEIVSVSEEYTLNYDYEVVMVSFVGEATITFKAGYETLPSEIRGWLLNKVSTLYENRENITVGTIVAKLPNNHVDSVLGMYKVRY